MKRLDKLMKVAKEKADIKAKEKVRQVFGRMSMAQLKELANENVPYERIREILASVDGLWLLEEGV